MTATRSPHSRARDLLGRVRGVAEAKPRRRRRAPHEPAPAVAAA